MRKSAWSADQQPTKQPLEPHRSAWREDWLVEIKLCWALFGGPVRSIQHILPLRDCHHPCHQLQPSFASLVTFSILQQPATLPFKFGISPAIPLLFQVVDDLLSSRNLRCILGRPTFAIHATHPQQRFILVTAVLCRHRTQSPWPKREDDGRNPNRQPSPSFAITIVEPLAWAVCLLSSAASLSKL